MDPSVYRRRFVCPRCGAERKDGETLRVHRESSLCFADLQPVDTAADYAIEHLKTTDAIQASIQANFKEFCAATKKNSNTSPKTEEEIF
jgi:hypothetical protein